MVIFWPSGDSVELLGRHGTGPGELAGPTEMEVSANGQIAVADAQNARITIWNPDHSLLTEIPVLRGSVRGLVWRDSVLYLRLGSYIENSPVSFRTILLSEQSIGPSIGGFLSYGLTSPEGDRA